MKKDLNTGRLLDFYAPLLTERQSEALDMYYNMDYSLSEIADHFGVTRQCVRGYIQNGEAHMHKMEEALCHAALFAAAETALSALRGEGSLEEAAGALSAVLKD